MVVITYILIYVIVSFISVSCLYVSYILLMELIKKYGRETLPMQGLILIFLALDSLVNILVVTVWSVDLPKELLVTARLKRWREGTEIGFNSLTTGSKNRLIFAVWMCDTKLDQFDTITGDHC